MPAPAFAFARNGQVAVGHLHGLDFEVNRGCLECAVLHGGLQQAKKGCKPRENSGKE